MKFKLLLLGGLIFFSQKSSFAQKPFSVIGYYAGPSTTLDSFEVNKLTEIIFSFAHLRGNQLGIMNARDSATLEEMVRLKDKNPKLKVIISLGGWGGCAPCSDVFSSKDDRKTFAKSVKEITQHFHTDGIDLDWEYPAIAGFPSHKYKSEDKENFTKLVKILRRTLGKSKEISFAAGGFSGYIQKSIEWKKVMKKVDRVNLMSYDLVDGYATTTGNHTPLFSNSKQTESTDHAVEEMLALGVPAHKIAIGAAFYAKVWQEVADTSDGMYQPGKYKMGVSFKNFSKQLSADSGFVYHWDSVAQAPFLYNPQQRIFATFDDKKSIELKTKYAIEKGLNGIMFWQLHDDSFTDGLLDEIDQAKKDMKTIVSK
ncbi:MAG TPA: glycosyl hydrolase family 18 protein [Hanamia sp.]|nr:glycosyl hydrolase family 18 protein [Hanamia sp.]